MTDLGRATFDDDQIVASVGRRRRWLSVGVVVVAAHVLLAIVVPWLPLQSTSEQQSDAILAGGKFDTGAAATWLEGDFSYDGIVDILDAADFVTTGLYNTGNYNTAPGVAGAVAAVPEPSSVALAAGGMMAAVGWGIRRRFR